MSSEARLLGRVLPAFGQLATGVRALHQARMLHRDLKPSNVLVSQDRVVVLDFGLVRDLDGKSASLTEEGIISGTPAYMAPEQALGIALTEASDWYAFGAMLYEALTGELPFDGQVLELLRAKLDRDPKPPTDYDPSLPGYVSDLCMALLARNPADRPHGDDVIARLEAWTRTDPPPQTLFPHSAADNDSQAASPVAPFFGRLAELIALEEAMKRVAGGSTGVVHVRGKSGSGKSALVEHFLDDLEGRPIAAGGPRPLVLRSRCYEREAMPFKALDGVVDALVHDLARMDEFEVSHLLPTDIDVLSQLFPVLERLRAVQRLISSRPPDADAVRNRDRAEAALRELFSRLAARRPVVIWIDDVQWGDLDSAGILRDWLEDSAKLPLLFLLSYRGDEVGTSECLRLLMASEAFADPGITNSLELAALAAGDLRRLFLQKLAPFQLSDPALIDHMVCEAQGSPFLAAQLATLAEEKLRRGDPDVATLSIADLVEQTNAMLPLEATHLLSVLAVAGRPILPKLALEVAGIERGGRDVVHALGRLQLVRTRNAGGERLLEVYHDRVRRGVQQTLQPSQSERLHARLLQVLERSGRADDEWLHTVALSAKDHEATLRYGLLAADHARSTLAFERAAELYQRCLDFTAETDEGRGALYFKLAVVLSSCGRGSMAAAAYLEASKLASGKEAVHLMRLASSHLLRSGRFEEGEAMLQRVLQAMGVAVPKSPAGLVCAIAWERMRLRFRGVRYTPRKEAEIAPDVLSRIDTFNALRAEIGATDSIRSALFLAWQLRWALDAGEPMRVLQGLFGASSLESAIGSPKAERATDSLLQQIDGIAEQLDTLDARIYAHGARAIVSWMLGRWEDVAAPAEQVERCYQDQAGQMLEGYYYLRQAVLASRIGAAYELSEFSTAASELRLVVRLAERTDNRAALLQLTLNRTVVDEIGGRPEVAVERLKAERPQLPAVGFGTYHALHMVSVCWAACASGEHAWGRRLLEEDWPRFLRSPLHRISMITFLAHSARVQLLLNQHLTQQPAASKVPAALYQEVRTLADCYLKRRAQPQAQVCEARLAHSEGDTPRALGLLKDSIEHCMCPAEIERAQYAMGVMIGGEQGADLQARAVALLRERTVADPRRYLAGHFPELAQ